LKKGSKKLGSSLAMRTKISTNTLLNAQNRKEYISLYCCGSGIKPPEEINVPRIRDVIAIKVA
jgi:hypothetical protein